MLVDCLMQVYRIGFLVTSLPVNCNIVSGGGLDFKKQVLLSSERYDILFMAVSFRCVC